MAYLGFHFGGGGSKYFGKVEIFAWRETPCSAWRSHTFVRGVQGHAPTRKFLKMVQLGAFWRIFLLKFIKKKCKNIHFYIKIIDNVLLRTLYLGVLEHTPQISCQLCNLVCFGAHFP